MGCGLEIGDLAPCGVVESARPKRCGIHDGFGASRQVRDQVAGAGADAEAVLKLIESLDDLDDVQKVDANFDIDASVMSGLNS